MTEWLETPLVVTALLAVGGVIWAAARWTGKVDGKLQDLTTAVDEVRADIKKIFRRLPAPVVAGASPLRLTDLGKEIADRLDARQWAGQLAPTLVQEVAGKRPFEIDEFSEEFVNARLDREWADRVAGCAYDFEIQRDRVRTVLRVVLRDELLRLAVLPREAS